MGLSANVTNLVVYFCFFAEKMGDVDADEVSCQSWSSKVPKVVQPDLNYIGN